MNINPIRSTPQPIKENQNKRPDAPPQSDAPAKSPLELKKAISRAADAESNSDQIADVLTPKEKEFFNKMFPSSENEIRSYNSYKRDGSRSIVRLGTVLDRKG